MMVTMYLVELMSEGRPKKCIVHLGDGGSEEFQVFCCKNGVLLRAATNIRASLNILYFSFLIQFKCMVDYITVVTFDAKNQKLQ